MLNPSAVGNDAYDFIGGNISDFFADVDNAITMSECVKGQYRLTVQPAVNANDNIITPNFATVNLSSPGSLVVDLDNSFISLEAVLSLSSNLAKEEVAKGTDIFYFVGFKSSFEAIRQYEILVNGNTVYTQSFSPVESFIQDQIVTELVRNTSQYIYSSWDNVRRLKPDVCGTYINFNTLTGGAKLKAYVVNTNMNVKIPLKIPIDRFLILKNLKYMLSWMGKWELRLYFDPSALVVTPVLSVPLVQEIYDGWSLVPGAVKTEFTQLNDPFKGISKATFDAGVLTVAASGDETWRCSKMVCNSVESNLATFQLRADVVEELKAKYLERPLTFPVNFFNINRFAGTPSMAQISHILSTTVNNCDTLFLLIPNTPNSLTCFFNPFIQNFQLDAGPYGTYPSQPMDTFNNVRFVNMIADSLNVNNSVLTSFNKDCDSSFCLSSHHYQFLKDINDDAANTYTFAYHKGDQSNFFIGIPFSVDNDYQGGMSSPSSSIVFKVSGQAPATEANKCPRHLPAREQWNHNWYALFLIDGSLMIKPDASGEAARVIYSERSIV
jgi:hypothetical protein